MNNLVKSIQTQMKSKATAFVISQTVNSLIQVIKNKQVTAATIKPVQETLVSYLTSQNVITQASRALLEIIAVAVSLVYENGDPSKIMGTFIEPQIASINSLSSSSQAASSERLARIYLLSKVFQTVNQSCFVGCPPTKELIDLFLKIAQKNNQAILRIYCFQGITRVTKVGTQNISQVLPDLIKAHTKVLDKIYQTEQMSQQQEQIAKQCLKALIAVVKKSFSYILVSQYFDQLSQLCLRNFHGPHLSPKKYYLAELLTELLTLRLEESKKQCDIKMSFKKYLEQQQSQEQEKETRKRKNTQVLEAPRNLGEVYSWLCALMYKNGLSVFFVENIVQTLKFVSLRNQLHLDALATDHMINSLLLALQPQTLEKKDKESAKDAEKKQKMLVTNILICSTDLMEQVISCMANAQKKQLLESVKLTLDQKLLIMHMETVELFTPQFNSSKDKLKVSSMLNSHEQMELCLRVYGVLILNLDEPVLFSIFQNEVEILAPILPFLKDDNVKMSSQKEAKKVISNLAVKLNNVNWILNLLHQFLQLITIEHADILTIQQGHGHLPAGGSKQGDKSQVDLDRLDILDQKHRNLNALSQCLAYLLKQVTKKTEQGDIPQALSESTLKISKNLILGTFKIPDIQEKQKGFLECYSSLKLADVLQSEEAGLSRKEAGWIILEGLFGLGEKWVSQNLESILMLFNSIFNKAICETKGFTKVAQILREFDLKITALNSLYRLIKEHKGLILENRDYLKTVSSMLGNCLEFLFSNSKEVEVKELQSIFYKASPRQYKEAKFQIIDAILMINNPGLFQSKIIIILHILCEQIVTTKKLNHIEHLLFPDFIKIADFSQKEQFNAPSGYDLVQAYLNESLVRSSILLFRNFFLTQNALLSKNKLQLIKHFESHTIIKPDKPETIQPVKIQKVALTCLALLKTNMELQGLDSIVPLEKEILERIANMVKNFQNMQSLSVPIPHLSLILSSLLMYQRLPLIMQNPNMINLLVTDHPEQFPLSAETKSLILCLLYRNFEPEVLSKHLDTETHLVKWIDSQMNQKNVLDGNEEALLYTISQLQLHIKDNRKLKQTLWNQANAILYGAKLQSPQYKQMKLLFSRLLVMFQDTKQNIDLYKGIQIQNMIHFDMKAILQKNDINYAMLELCLIDCVVSRRPVKKAADLKTIAKVFMGNDCPISTKVLLVHYLSMCLVHSSYQDSELGYQFSTSSILSVLLNMLNHTYINSSLTNSSQSLDIPSHSPNLLTLTLTSSCLQTLLILPLSTTAAPSPAPTLAHLHSLLTLACSLALRQAAMQHTSALSYTLQLLKTLSSFQYTSIGDAYNNEEGSGRSQMDDWKVRLDTQMFWTDLSEKTRIGIMGVLKQVLETAAVEVVKVEGVDGDAKKMAIIEKLGFKTKLYNLITEIYRIAKRDGIEFKKLGIQLMCLLIELMQDCHEEGDDDSSDEDDAKRKKKKPAGPLLLEEYEAQIQSVIVSSLHDVPQSMVICKEICRLVELFIGLGICQDKSSAQSVMSHVFGNLQYKPGGNTQGKAAACSDDSPQHKIKDFTWLSVSQMVPETICLNACMIKLKMVAKIQIIRIEQALKKGRRTAALGPLGVDVEMEKHYIQSMNEFLQQSFH